VTLLYVYPFLHAKRLLGCSIILYLILTRYIDNDHLQIDSVDFIYIIEFNSHELLVIRYLSIFEILLFISVLLIKINSK